MTYHRRSILKGAGLVAGAAVAGAAWTEPATAAAAADPDQLFRAGRFAAADHAYARLLRADPGNAHALAQRGYLALLSNKYADAERFLTPVAATDIRSAQRLADCYVRQDQHARAIPVLQSTGRPGDAATATQYVHLGPKPWQITGARRTRVPFLALDPLPHLEASINGGPAKPFIVDTYGTLTLTPETAADAGLTAVSTVVAVANNRPVTLYLGVLDSFRLGDIEIRNIPVAWVDGQQLDLPDGSTPAGVLGTTLLYHFLSTMDYANGELVLRRKGSRNPAGRNDLPLWLAGDHFACTVGRLGSGDPHIVTLDSGGIAHGFETTVEYAEQTGLTVDYSNPEQQNGVPVYPAVAGRMSLGHAVARDIRGVAVSAVWPGLPGPGLADLLGYDIKANFTHESLKQFALTFDYSAMRLSVTG
ncbi:hypothetical protein HDA40_007674 [Hamadaea flava]|uniref:Aspartyl protease family protein n=1 Tax=Hamadaea flava TaxID=1742688 RepID=A0ABV8LXV2_9ACTN|nr:aspartyl protease family protein [Hamadaea flava]MCP2329167.1 hypothetical protein [Hamadaea flava]